MSNNLLERTRIAPVVEDFTDGYSPRRLHVDESPIDYDDLRATTDFGYGERYYSETIAIGSLIRSLFHKKTANK
ncbi:MAG: hypothetical protein WBB94_02160 [Candidatus Saccharimonadaceae bacterium]